MADSDLTYLQPGFDPNTLTVPRLRSVLVAHNVAYPSSAKKSDLVNIFNNEVAPQARKLLSAQSRITRSSRGIVDVPSSQESTGGDDDDDDRDLESDENMAPLVTPGRRSTRRSTRTVSEDIVEPTPRPSRRSVAPASTVKRPSSKHARNDDDDERLEDRHVKRHVQPRAPLDQTTSVRGGESPFSHDNPFQSGSSPPSAPRSRSREPRRRTMAPSSTSIDKDRRKSREIRRRTDDYKLVAQNDGVVVPSRSTFDVHVSAPTSELDHDVIHAGEDFTLEERQDLVKSEQSTGTTVQRMPKRRPKKSGVAKAAPWTVLLAMLGGVATVWRQEKLQVGYCGVGEPSLSLAGVEIPEWASFIQPQCEPCPQHAYCYPDLRTVCEPDFVLTQHPLSLGGLVPLAPTCEPDGEKVRKVKAVADHAVEKELREHNAAYECGTVSTPYVEDKVLKETVSAKRSKRMTDQEFNELWGLAIGEIAGREEVETSASEE